MDDGGETDLDLGNYERFLDINLTSGHSLTSGKVFKSVIDKERRGDYLGQTVQMVPHITDFIQEHILNVSQIPVNNGVPEVPDVCIVELGGTVGDHEGAIYYEALADFATRERCCFVHVSLIPVVHGNEIKTKPTQHSIKAIRALGISPDVLILRCKRGLSDSEISKVSKYCKMSKESIIVNKNVDTIYRVPNLFLHQRVIPIIKKVLHISKFPKEIPDLGEYHDILKHFNVVNKNITISIVGKYIGMQDTYLSLIRAIEHASFKIGVNAVIDWVDCELSDSDLIERVSASNGVIIPGGFGNRGIDGMITVARWCRQHNHPLLGICLGMQIMCIDLDRDLNNHPFATSEEFDKEDSRIHTVILSDVAQTQLGATMRLGSYKCKLKRGTVTRKMYDTEFISERHRHRYEVSSRFVSELTNVASGTIVFSGYDVRGRYPEILEHLRHPFYVGCQFHPEFSSRHSTAHPLFVGFLNASNSSNN